MRLILWGKLSGYVVDEINNFIWRCRITQVQDNTDSTSSYQITWLAPISSPRIELSMADNSKSQDCSASMRSKGAEDTSSPKDPLSSTPEDMFQFALTKTSRSDSPSQKNPSDTSSTEEEPSIDLINKHYPQSSNSTTSFTTQQFNLKISDKLT